MPKIKIRRNLSFEILVGFSRSRFSFYLLLVLTLALLYLSK